MNECAEVFQIKFLIDLSYGGIMLGYSSYELRLDNVCGLVYILYIIVFEIDELRWTSSLMRDHNSSKLWM